MSEKKASARKGLKKAAVKSNDNDKKVDITVDVDVSKIVRNVSIAGVLIVGIIFGCNTYRKLLAWEKE